MKSRENTHLMFVVGVVERVRADNQKDPVNRAEDGSSCTGTGGSWRVRRRRRVHTGCAKVGKKVCWRGSGNCVLGRK